MLAFFSGSGDFGERRIELDVTQTHTHSNSENCAGKKGEEEAREREGRMKVVSICTMRYNRDTAEPVMLSQVNELASFGFFQRQG